MPKFFHIVIYFVLILACSCSNSNYSADTKPPKDIGLDAVRVKCNVEELYPSQSLWAQALILPGCMGSNSESLVENIFTLGVLSYSYNNLMTKYGIADGAKNNKFISSEDKIKYEMSSLEYYVEQDTLRDQKLSENVQKLSHKCISTSMLSGIFSIGQGCSMRYAALVKEPYMQACKDLCSSGNTDPKQKFDCEVFCSSSYVKRLEEQEKLIKIYNEALIKLKN